MTEKYKREPISKKTRFNIFTRDGFKCQYCGRSAGEVVLEIDHIIPVVEGGTNDPLNLTTACFDCNRGKGKQQLEPEQFIDSQITELKDLQLLKEKQEQVLAWKRSLLDLKKDTSIEIQQYFEDLFCITTKSPSTLHREVFRLLVDYSVSEILEAIDALFAKRKTANEAFAMLSATLKNRRLMEKNPLTGQKQYLFGILKNRFGTDPKSAFTFMNQINFDIVDIIQVQELAKTAKTYAEWKSQCLGLAPLVNQGDL